MKQIKCVVNQYGELLSSKNGIFFFERITKDALKYCVSSIKEIESGINYDSSCLDDAILEEKVFYV